MYKETNVELLIKNLYLLDNDEIYKREKALLSRTTNSNFSVIGYVSLDITDENIFCMGDSVETREIYFPIVNILSEKSYSNPHLFKVDPVTGEIQEGDGDTVELDMVRAICSAVYKKPGEEYKIRKIDFGRFSDANEDDRKFELPFYVTVTIKDEQPENPENPQIIDVDYVYNRITYYGDYIDNPTLALFNRINNLTYPIL